MKTALTRDLNPPMGIFVDMSLILLFFLAGIIFHDRFHTEAALFSQEGVMQLFGAAFPYMLAGLGAWAWLIVKSSFQIMRGGLIVFATTAVVGPIFRFMNAQNVDPVFVLLSTGFLAVLLLGWRLIVAVIMRNQPVETSA